MKQKYVPNHIFLPNKKVALAKTLCAPLLHRVTLHAFGLAADQSTCSLLVEQKNIGDVNTVGWDVEGTGENVSTMNDHIMVVYGRLMDSPSSA